MRLVTFTVAGGAPRCGALIDGDRSVVDLQAARTARTNRPDPALESVLAIAGGGAAALEAAAEAVRGAPQSSVFARSAVRLLAPVPAPPQMRDFLCFEKHLQQAFKAARVVRSRQSADPDAALRDMEANGILAVPQVWYERPIYYHPNRLNVIGTEEDAHWPPYCELMDFELEFGCYIGRGGRDIPRERAREHIFGYTIFNDFSARDEQVKEMPGQLGPGKGKDFDGGNAMGPCLVTADEIDPYRLTMICRVNGEEWGRGHSSEMGWKFEDCIAHVSRGETLHPGEFFGSGTVGNGCGLEHMRYLRPGDQVELEVEGIGILRNRVVRAWPVEASAIGERLATHGVAVIDDFLDQAALAAWSAHAECSRALLAPARLGKARILDPAQRGDRICWLDLEDGPPLARQLGERMEALRAGLNRELFLGLAGLELHLALYPTGARYAPHRDRFREDDARTLSCVIYLNRGWDPAWGGQLRLWHHEPPAGPAAGCEDIDPLGGRMVLFRADGPLHEVLPAVRERWSLTGWFRRRVNP